MFSNNHAGLLSTHGMIESNYGMSSAQFTWHDVVVAVLRLVNRQPGDAPRMSWTQAEQQLQQIHLLLMSNMNDNSTQLVIKNHSFVVVIVGSLGQN